MIKYTIIPGCLVADAKNPDRRDVIKSMMNKSVTDMRWYGNSTNVVHLGHLINRLDETRPLIVEELAERGFKYVGDGKVDGITGSERLDKAFSDDGGPVKQDCSDDSCCKTMGSATEAVNCAQAKRSIYNHALAQLRSGNSVFDAARSAFDLNKGIDISLEADVVREVVKSAVRTASIGDSEDSVDDDIKHALSDYVKTRLTHGDLDDRIRGIVREEFERLRGKVADG